jgi:hypothetical protein
VATEEKSMQKRVRILAVDDEQDVLDAYQDAFSSDQANPESEFQFDVMLRAQGDQAVDAAREAQHSGQPFSVVAVRPNFVKLGRLIDIAQDGLSFQYLGQSGETGSRLKEMASIEIDIFLKGSKYYLPGMPCVLIYDRKSEPGGSFPAGLETRRCGLKFGQLQKEQMSRLEFYIERYSAEGISQPDAINAAGCIRTNPAFRKSG